MEKYFEFRYAIEMTGFIVLCIIIAIPFIFVLLAKWFDFLNGIHEKRRRKYEQEKYDKGDE